MRSRKRPRIVFLADMTEHSARESCLGAALYAAKTKLVFEPWSVLSEIAPKPSEFAYVDGILLTEPACLKVFGPKPKITAPHIFVLNTTLSPGSTVVEFDEAAIGRTAAEHLIQRGYRNLVSVSSLNCEWSRLRVEGFHDECARAGIPVKHKQFSEEVLPASWRYRTQRKHEPLAEFLRDLPKPTGVFAVNDVSASFVIEIGREKGIRIPQEIGVIGANADPLPNAAAGLSISSVEPSFRAVGWEAASLLDRYLQGKKIPLRKIYPPVRVIVRTSTDAFMVENSLVRRAQAYIESHRNQTVLVAEVARAVGSTTVTLGKYFQEHINSTPSEYILQRRIEYSKELLREGKLNVEEISSVCGFHSSSYFCHVFKNLTGVTPGSLRV